MIDAPEPQVRTVLVRRRRDVARAAIVVVAALVMIVGAAVASGASPTTGANPSAAAPSAKIDKNGESKPGKPDRVRIGGLRLPGLGFGKGDRPQRGGGQITITAINGSSVSLKTDDGWTRTVTVAPDTKVFTGSVAGALGDLKVGDKVRLRQQRNADGTFTVLALVVEVPRAAGAVSGVTGNTVTVKLRDGSTATITLNGATKFQVGKAAASKSDIHVGSRIVVEGTGSATSLTATVVRIQPTIASGQVTAKTANSITIKLRDGSSLTIHIDAKTTFRVRGAATKPGTLADIKVGDRLIASGTARADKSLDASSVGAGPARAPKSTTDKPTG